MTNRSNRKADFLARCWWLLLASFITLSSVSAQNVILYLRNGDRISGAIVSENSYSITIATAYATNLTVPVQQITRREHAPLPEASRPDASHPTPQLVSPKLSSTTNAPVSPSGNTAKQNSTNKVAAGKVPEATSPRAGSTNVLSPLGIQKFLADWKGELEVGLNLGLSSKDRQLYTGQFKATHTPRTFLRNILDYNMSYGRTEGVLSDDRMDGSWKTEYDLSKRFSVYNVVGAGFDDIRKIDLQYDLGPGFGYKWLVRTNLVFKNELGGNYQKQMFADDADRKRYSLRLAEDFWWQITSKIRWDEKLEFFPQVDDLSNYRIRAESNLSYLLRNNLSLNLAVIDLYDPSAPGNVSLNDLQIRSTLGIRF